MPPPLVHHHFRSTSFMPSSTLRMRVYSARFLGKVSWAPARKRRFGQFIFQSCHIPVWSGYDTGSQPFGITYGYSKDKRPDLKQYLVSMLCVDRSMPILGGPTDGNASDKSVNNEVLTGISKHMARYGLQPGAFVYVADSAFVTANPGCGRQTQCAVPQPASGHLPRMRPGH